MGTTEYHTVTGSIVVTIPDEWSDVLEDMNRADRNNDHRYWRQDRRHTKFFSYEAWNPDGRRSAAAAPSAEDQFLALEAQRDSVDRTQALHAAIALLPTSQQSLIFALIAGKLQQEIVAERGISPAAVSRQKSRAIKNLRKLLSSD